MKLQYLEKKYFDLQSLINWLVQQPTTAENVAKRFGNYLIGEDVKTENISKIIERFQRLVTYNLKFFIKALNLANNI